MRNADFRTWSCRSGFSWGWTRYSPNSSILCLGRNKLQSVTYVNRRFFLDWGTVACPSGRFPSGGRNQRPVTLNLDGYDVATETNLRVHFRERVSPISSRLSWREPWSAPPTLPPRGVPALWSRRRPSQPWERVCRSISRIGGPLLNEHLQPRNDLQALGDGHLRQLGLRRAVNQVEDDLVFSSFSSSGDCLFPFIPTGLR